mmetsp:Transcript_76447/g.212347  ORF Transcript_76447/g.212347 Transcript_76447/m.212347 type:complete len:541 (-) Transcript_76447:21-1643(-)
MAASCLEASGPHPALLDAVERLGLRCTAGEAAASSGLPIGVAEDELNALLVRAAGSFAVVGEAGTEAGERVVYSFPADFRGRVRRERRRAALWDLWDRVAPVGFYVLRMALGIFIFVSLAIILLAVAISALAAFVALMKSGEGGDARNHGGWNLGRIQARLHHMTAVWNQFMCLYMCCGGANPFFIPPVFDPFYWGYAHGFFGIGSSYRRPMFWRGGFYRHTSWTQPWRPRSSDDDAAPSPAVVGAPSESSNARMVAGRIVRDVPARARQVQDQGAASSMEVANVVDAVFSFLFGDGVPQPSALERWRLVATVIRREGGVISAETLAPYLERPAPAPAPADREYCVSEEFIAPVVEHFRGRPEVVPGGRGLIVYVFAELLGDSAARTLGLASRAPEVPRSLAEGEWVFSQRSSRELQATAALGLVNLCGAFWISIATGSRGSIRTYVGPLTALTLGWIARWALLPYAVLFVAVPAVRAIVQVLANIGVRSRNTTRDCHADRIEAAGTETGSAFLDKLRYATVLRKSVAMTPVAPSAGVAV